MGTCPLSADLHCKSPAGQWMRKGFVYLVAMMDWFTRKVQAWRISNTLESEFCIEVNRPGFTGGQNSWRIAHFGTDTKEEDHESVFPRVPRTCA